MLRWKSSLLLLVLLAANLAQSGTPLANADVRRIGNRLGCQCGCQASLTECNMINCHFADPAREELLRRVLAGESEPAIINAFVERYGNVILRQPPEQGFFLLSWIMPVIGIAAGLAFIGWFIRRTRRPAASAAGPGIGLDSEEYERYRDRIEKDLSKLD